MYQTRARQRSSTFILLATALLLPGAISPRGVGMQSPADEAVDYNASSLIAITGTSGLFAFAGHRHAVLASEWSADLKMNLDDLGRASATITLPAAKLVIDSPAARQKAGLGGGPGDSEVRTIQQRMLSSEVLDAAQYPRIKFTTTAIKAQGSGQLQVTGNMEIHGRSHPVTIQARYRSDGRQTALDGEFEIRQTDYGLRPESVAGGTVKVKNQIAIKFHIVMKAAR
ncbi:MAG: YceI family protein [Acidobacteria bacterium]|nr:MAG: YceI family protein [Acidobacteriota bacterium]